MFEPAWLTRFDYQDRVAHELDALAGELPYGKRRQALKRKAAAFRLCGRKTMVETCRDCGKNIPGTGVQKAAAYPCGLRICNVCERRASKERCDDLLASMMQASARAPEFPAADEGTCDLRAFPWR